MCVSRLFAVMCVDGERLVKTDDGVTQRPLLRSFVTFEIPPGRCRISDVGVVQVKQRFAADRDLTLVLRIE